MNYNNSRIFHAFPLEIKPDIPLSINITADGILPIYPIQWSGFDIPIVLSVAGLSSCSTIMHYCSGDFDISGDLGTVCISLSTDSTSGIFAQADGTCNTFEGGYYKTSINIPTSAIPPAEDIYEVDECDPSIVTRTRFRRKGINARIFATGTVTVETSSFEISGYSDTFTLYRFENYHDFRKINEDKSLSDILKEYSVQSMSERTDYFWNTYVYNLLGSDVVYEPNYTIPEKTANFFLNQNDIDTCEIPALYDKAQLMGYDMEKYILNYPSELQRVMNFISIPHDRVFGTKTDQYINEINGTHDINQEYDSVGDKMRLSDIITEEQTIFYHYKNSKDMFTEYLDSEDIGKTVEDAMTPLLTSIYINPSIDGFCFYKATPYTKLKDENSLLDYNNDSNLLERMDYNDWMKDAGVVDEIINYVLYKNLIE